MSSSQILAGHVNINIKAQSGTVPASHSPANFVLSVGKGDVANYAREGDDLIIELVNGEILTIKNFFLERVDYHNLIFADGGAVWLVDFSKGYRLDGDGIADGDVAYQKIEGEDSNAVMVLLGLLGAAATAAGVGFALQDKDSAIPVPSTDEEKKDIEEKDPVKPVDPPVEPTVPPTPPVEPLPPAPPPQPTPPDAVSSITAISEDTGLAGDFVTSDTTLVIHGRISEELKVGERVQIRIDGGDWQDVTVTGTNWSYDHTGVKWDDGSYLVETRTINIAGNVTDGNHERITIDTNGPNNATIAIAGYIDDELPIEGTNIVSGSSTNDPTPIIFGTATLDQPDDYVVVMMRGSDGKWVELGKATLNGQGGWRFPVETILEDGDYHFKAVVYDKAGNKGRESGEFDITIDTLPPAAIDEVKLNLHDDVDPITGTIKQGSDTDDAMPTYSGAPGCVNAKEVQKIYIYDKGDKIGEVDVNEDGSWVFEPNPPLTAGQHELTARAVDAAGNIGPATKGWDFNLLGTPPESPSIEQVYDNQLPVMAVVQKDAVTDDTRPTVSGMGTPGTMIKILITLPDGSSYTLTQLVKVGVDGRWSVELPSLTGGDGRYIIQAKAVDSAGQESVLSGGYPIVLDTTPPNKPPLPILTDNEGTMTGAVTSGKVIDDNRPVISGNAGVKEAGGTVIVYVDGVAIDQPVKIGSDGSWSLIPTTAWGDGHHKITVRVSDVAGNVSDPSDAFDVEIDTSNVVVQVTGFFDHKEPITGKVTLIGKNGILCTDDPAPEIQGIAKPHSKIVITYLDADGHTVTLVSTLADAAGSWSLIPSLPLDDGIYQFTVTATDLTGQTHTTTARLEIDTKAPEITLEEVSDDRDTVSIPIIDGGVTNDRTPTLVGTSEPGAKIKIYDGNKLIGEVTADGHGAWSITTPPLSEGEHTLFVTASDDVGNTSEKLRHKIEIDTTPPATTAHLSAITEDRGVSNSDFITNDNTLVYSFTPDTPLGANETIWMRIKLAGDGQVIANWRQAILKDGVWQIDDTQQSRPDGIYEIEVAVRDAAGNVGASTRTIIEIDREVGSNHDISILNYTDHVGKDQGEFGSNTTTDDRNPTLNGIINTPLADDEMIMVTMVVNGVQTILGPVTVASNGKHWSIDLPDLENGSSPIFTAKIVDIAGNEGSISNDFTINVDLSILIDHQQTTNATPIITGSTDFDMRHGEYMEVTVNGKTYSSKTGQVVIDPRNSTWYVKIPKEHGLSVGFHEVEAKLFSKDGKQITTDNSHNELEIMTEPSVVVTDGGKDADEKATAVTMDENGNWMIFTNQTIMRGNGTNNGTLGDFDIIKVKSQQGGAHGGHNYVQNGTWMDFDRDGYMDFFGTDNSYNNGQQAFLNNGDGSFRAYHIGLTHLDGGAKAGTGNGSNESQNDYNPEGNAYVWYGGVVAFDKTGEGLTSIIYGDQTPGDPQTPTKNGKPTTASAIVINTDGTTTGFDKDTNFQGHTPTSNANRDQMQPDMELSGIDLDNNGTIDLIFHATALRNHLGKGWERDHDYSSNPYRLVVASNEGNGDWRVAQIVNDVFHRNDDDPNVTNGVAMTWADFDGDGYMDLFLGRGHGNNRQERNQSRILFNDGKGHIDMNNGHQEGISTAKKVYKFKDNLAGGASLAIDWNHDGKMDIIELPTLNGKGVNDVTRNERVGQVNLYTNSSTGKKISFTTSNLLGGSRTIGNNIDENGANGAKADWVTGAVTVDIDWDGARDLLVFTRNGNTQYIHNDNVIEHGTALHFKILDKEGINAFYGNTVQLYDSKGKLVSTQVINPQSGNQTNDSSALVDFYGLDPNETYTLVMLHHYLGTPSHIGGVASIGGKTIANVNAAWANIKAGEANDAIILTAESDTNSSNANKANGIVGTGYNDTFYATKGQDAYFGGGGTVTISGKKVWSDKGGMDIVDYKLARVALTIDLSVKDWQNTGFNTAKFEGIEGLNGSFGNDIFTDDAGDNVFNGRGGNDTYNLIHGGKDTIIYQLIDNKDATGGNGQDVINGFTIGTYEATPNADRIDLAELLIGYVTDKDGAAHYINGKPVIDKGDNIADYLHIRHVNGNSEIWIDRDGVGTEFDSTRLVTLNNITVELAELLANHQIIVG